MGLYSIHSLWRRTCWVVFACIRGLLAVQLGLQRVPLSPLLQSSRHLFSDPHHYNGFNNLGVFPFESLGLITPVESPLEFGHESSRGLWPCLLYLVYCPTPVTASCSVSGVCPLLSICAAQICEITSPLGLAPFSCLGVLLSHWIFHFATKIIFENIWLSSFLASELYNITLDCAYPKCY